MNRKEPYSKSDKSLHALENAQQAFEGAAAEVGLKNEEDVIALVKQLREKRRPKSKRNLGTPKKDCGEDSLVE